MKSTTHGRPATVKAVARQFYRDVLQIMLQPGKFYEAMPVEKSLQAGMIFLCISASLYSALTMIFVPEPHLLLLFLFFLNGFLMPIAVAAILHQVLRLFQPVVQGFDLMLGITAYANTAILFAWIPGMAPFAELFKYYLIGLGLVKVTRLGAFKGLLALLGAGAILLTLIHLFQALFKF